MKKNSKNSNYMRQNIKKIVKPIILTNYKKKKIVKIKLYFIKCTYILYIVCLALMLVCFIRSLTICLSDCKLQTAVRCNPT